MAAMQPARRLYADPAGLFLHQAILNSCQKFAAKTALRDTSTYPPRQISYGEYGELVECVARGLIAAGLQPGEVIGIFLWNCWEFPVGYHAATLAGAIPTLLNPSYREREARYQLETADAVVLITDAAQIAGMNLPSLPKLRRVYTTRTSAPGTHSFSELLPSNSAALPTPLQSPEETLAALPFSSGTTGMPKGVMLTHFNLV